MKYDFYGFKFNGVHTSELGIVRVSDGSRYNDNLLPTFQDKTAQAVGRDGTLYWESFSINKTWAIKIAFDSLSEVNYRRMRQVFNEKDIGELIFDELPFKVYTAKVQNTPQLTTICFDLPNGQRVYKGEGTINFIAYYPYARSKYKFLNDYEDSEFDNKDQWAAASGMLYSKNSLTNLDACPSSNARLYNPGDIESDLIICFDGSDLPTYINLNIGHELRALRLNPIVLKGSDIGIYIDMRTNLIRGRDIKGYTGNFYNEYIKSGDFFKIPLNSSIIIGNQILLSSDAEWVALDYDYWYY